MDFTVVFGDVFRYRGEEYVYFAESATQDIIFAGKILDLPFTDRLLLIEQSRQTKNTPTHRTPVFSYVVLSTEEFDRRAVLCAEGVDGVHRVGLPHARLSEDDIQSIREEILSGPAPKKLQELISLLT